MKTGGGKSKEGEEYNEPRYYDIAVGDESEDEKRETKERKKAEKEDEEGEENMQATDEWMKSFEELMSPSVSTDVVTHMAWHGEARWRVPREKEEEVSIAAVSTERLVDQATRAGLALDDKAKAALEEIGHKKAEELLGRLVLRGGEIRNVSAYVRRAVQREAAKGQKQTEEKAEDEEMPEEWPEEGLEEEGEGEHDEEGGGQEEGEGGHGGEGGGQDGAEGEWDEEGGEQAEYCEAGGDGLDEDHAGEAAWDDGGEDETWGDDGYEEQDEEW